MLKWEHSTQQFFWYSWISTTLKFCVFNLWSLKRWTKFHYLMRFIVLGDTINVLFTFWYSYKPHNVHVYLIIILFFHSWCMFSVIKPRLNWEMFVLKIKYAISTMIFFSWARSVSVNRFLWIRIGHRRELVMDDQTSYGRNQANRKSVRLPFSF